jgi:WD40 repeat protein
MAAAILVFGPLARSQGQSDVAEQPKAILKGPAKKLAFSPDGKMLATTGHKPYPVTSPGPGEAWVDLWEVSTVKHRARLRGHTEEILSVSFSPDGRLLASGGIDGSIRLWDLTTGRVKVVLQSPINTVGFVDFSGDGKLLVSLEGFDVKIRDMATLKLRTIIKGKDDIPSDVIPGYSSLACSKDDVLVAYAFNGLDIKLLDVARGKVVATLSSHPGGVQYVAFRSDGKALASAGGDGVVRLWDVAARKSIAMLRGHSEPVAAVVFSPDGKLLASAGVDGTVRLWDASAGKERITLRWHRDDVTIWSVAFSPNGRLVAAADGNEVRLWDVDTLLKANK